MNNNEYAYSLIMNTYVNHMNTIDSLNSMNTNNVIV